MAAKWQVCELEDSLKCIAEKFTVSAIPETWIIRQKDGSLICYWPKKNAVLKIRSLQPPKSGGTYYKCRILFDGETFSSYKKARAAEIMAQHYSIMAASETKEICESTMDFDVSNVDIEDTNDTSGSDDTQYKNMFTVSPIDDVNEIVGNDSSEYNRKMLKTGEYYQNPTVFEVEDDSDNNLLSVNEEMAYESFLQSKNQFLTSTALSESAIHVMDGVDDANRDDAPVDSLEYTILSKILLIKTKISTFVQSTHAELDDIKKMILNGRKVEHSDSQTDYIFNCEYSAPPNQPNRSSLDANPCKVSKEENFELSNGGYNTEHAEIIKLPIDTTPSDPIIATYTNEFQGYFDILDETFVVTSGHADHSNDKAGPNMNANDKIVGQLNEVIPVILNNREQQIEANDETNVAPTLIKPVDDVGQYRNNEDLLAVEEELENQLIEDLKPFRDENETDYMNRTVFIAFTKNFLLNHVSWKVEKGRVNIKHGRLLKCWKESYAKKFTPDEGNERFKYHIRRLKSSLRANEKRRLKGQKVTQNKRKTLGPYQHK